MQNISILGSTGSIGKQALNIVKNNRDKFNVTALSAHSNINLLKQQLAEFKPQYCVITDERQKSNILAEDFPQTSIEFGSKYLKNAVTMPDTDIVLIAIVGLPALDATIEAIKAKKRVALANKEVMVSAGEYITALQDEYNAEIIPVDSEHSAIFQCMCGQKAENLKRIILTASGGAFRDLDKNQLKNVTPEMALKHPNWNMGKKITVDSATLMNKGLEVIEAKWFFGLSGVKIDCIIHPQSIIHSMIELTDNSVLAQMSYPSMEIPILLSFTYPNRIPSSMLPLDFKRLKSLDFYEIDNEKYPCLNLAYDALKSGGLYPAILNSANDEAVRLFLDKKIAFLDIPVIIEKALNKIDAVIKPTAQSVYYIDKEVKRFVATIVKE